MTDRLLVTGGSGLLGQAVRRLRPDAIFLSSRDGDLRDRSVTDRLLQSIRPGQILHLAGVVGGVKANAADNARFLEDNILINAAVLSAARQLRVPRLTTMLSSCAFPFYADRPTTEADLQTALPYDGNAGYAYAKRVLDLHVGLAAKDAGLAWNSLTPVTMYGPYDSFDLESGHVVGALIRRCHEAQRTGSPFTVWGSGQAIRQFVYVDDVARLALRALEGAWGHGTTIVTPDEGISIADLADTIGRVMGYPGPIVFDTAQPEGVTVKRVQSTTFGERFPGVRFTSLDDGLAETVRWFLSREAGQTRPHLDASVCGHS
ncbi:MAG: NAD-dependent epimerase/dehydratase family protein [Nitrospira sp.]